MEKVRTHPRAIRRLRQLVLDQYPRQGPGYLSISHASAPDEARQLADSLAEDLDLEHVPVYDMPPAIVTHAGPGVVAAAFFN